MNLRSLLPAWLRSGDESRARTVQPKNAPYVVEFFGGTPSTAGVTVTESTSLTLSAVFACVRNLSEDVAKLPFIVYRSVQPRGKERLPAHPLYRLLHDEPNPEMSAFDFRQGVTACAVLWGGGYAEIERTNGGLPIALWPIEPWRMRATRDLSGRLYYEVDGGLARLETSDVLHVKGFGINGILGLMMAKVGGESMGLAMAAQKFASSFFGNGARVSGVLTHPKTLSEQAQKNLRKSFVEVHSGNGQFMPAILEEGTTWTPTSTPPNDAQMLETRQFQVEDVARWFRMPPHKIQHLMRSTFSNIEHQSIEYVVDTLTPWFVRWEQECKRKLVERSDAGVFAEHLVQGLLRGDIQSRYAAYAVARQNGWINSNEIRELENQNAIEGEGGEAYLVNGNMITVEAAMRAKAASDTGNTPTETTGEPVKPDTDTTRSAITEANRSALLDSARRAVRREVEVIRRKAKNLATAQDAVTAFYASHADYVRSAIGPAASAYMRSLAAVGVGSGVPESIVDTVANAYVSSASDEWRNLLSRATDETVEAALSEWESLQSQKLTEQILQQVNNG